MTFGAQHKLEKLNDAVLDLWCRLLQAVPSAGLLLCRNTLRGQTALALAGRFRQRGIPEDRLVLRHVEPVGMQHLRLYDEIDVALDPFPWNGHTTACEALWMGVPVVALRGRTHAGRMTASVLTAVGMPELVAENPDAYIRAAAALAADLPWLAELRGSLRGRMSASPLCDGAAFTRGLEYAYRALWRRRCAPRG